MPKSHYKVLQLSSYSCSMSEVTRNYLRLTRYYRHEKLVEANFRERIKQINEAYFVLSDKEQRVVYNNRVAQLKVVFGRDAIISPDKQHSIYLTRLICRAYQLSSTKINYIRQNTHIANLFVIDEELFSSLDTKEQYQLIFILLSDPGFDIESIIPIIDFLFYNLTKAEVIHLDSLLASSEAILAVTHFPVLLDKISLKVLNYLGCNHRVLAEFLVRRHQSEISIDTLVSICDNFPDIDISKIKKSVKETVDRIKSIHDSEIKIWVPSIINLLGVSGLKLIKKYHPHIFIDVYGDFLHSKSIKKITLQDKEDLLDLLNTQDDSEQLYRHALFFAEVLKSANINRFRLFLQKYPPLLNTKKATFYASQFFVDKAHYMMVVMSDDWIEEIPFLITREFLVELVNNTKMLDEIESNPYAYKKLCKHMSDTFTSIDLKDYPRINSIFCSYQLLAKYTKENSRNISIQDFDKITRAIGFCLELLEINTNNPLIKYKVLELVDENDSQIIDSVLFDHWLLDTLNVCDEEQKSDLLCKFANSKGSNTDELISLRDNSLYFRLVLLDILDFEEEIQLAPDLDLLKQLSIAIDNHIEIFVSLIIENEVPNSRLNPIIFDYIVRAYIQLKIPMEGYGEDIVNLFRKLVLTGQLSFREIRNLSDIQLSVIIELNSQNHLLVDNFDKRFLQLDLETVLIWPLIKSDFNIEELLGLNNCQKVVLNGLYFYQKDVGYLNISSNFIERINEFVFGYILSCSISEHIIRLILPGCFGIMSAIDLSVGIEDALLYTVARLIKDAGVERRESLLLDCSNSGNHDLLFSMLVFLDQHEECSILKILSKTKETEEFFKTRQGQFISKSVLCELKKYSLTLSQKSSRKSFIIEQFIAKIDIGIHDIVYYLNDQEDVNEKVYIYLTKEFDTLIKDKELNKYEDACMYCKAVFGAILAACLLFLPLLSSNYNSMFFENDRIKNMKSMKNDIDHVFNSIQQAI
ncbi:MAG: DnaJ domain-containing protein [Legionellaceae bacterium]|nr:DnaJ domain-containing protein [Legionellaceae bacterium]